MEVQFQQIFNESQTVEIYDLDRQIVSDSFLFNFLLIIQKWRQSKAKHWGIWAR